MKEITNTEDSPDHLNNFRSVFDCVTSGAKH